MNPLKSLFFVLCALLLSGPLKAQELDCMISIQSQKVEGTDKKMFETLQTAIYEFMNNRKWTNYNFRLEERIECTIMITLNERPAVDEFRGTINVVLRRPVFNTAYNTILLNHYDKEFWFKYVEYQTLDYADGTFSSNLTQVLAFYANVFLGFYFDSFTLNGGTPFFEKAQDIVNVAQSSPEPGWKGFESQKNRYWLIENVLNGSNAPMRQFYYNYHRLGLDQMYDKLELGRAAVTESIGLLNKMYNAKPGLYLLQMTLDAKKDELVNIYSDSRVPPMEKNDVVNILKEIDPANGSKYLAILDSK
jgi:hypothetical protein